MSKKEAVGQIGLIAVHPAARGQSIAASLMQCADERYVKQVCSEAIVVTQREKQPACGLYKKRDIVFVLEPLSSIGGENDNITFDKVFIDGR